MNNLLSKSEEDAKRFAQKDIRADILTSTISGMFSCGVSTFEFFRLASHKSSSLEDILAAVSVASFGWLCVASGKRAYDKIKLYKSNLDKYKEKYWSFIKVEHNPSNYQS